MILRPAVLAVLALILCACTEAVAGQPVDSSRVATAGPLPFTPTIAERTNDRNDGTTFEPCTAYSDPELTSIGAIPASLADAAESDSPNYRGCHWSSHDEMWLLSQIVGNETSLERYKKKITYRTWLPDRTVNGRTLAIATDDAGACIVVFMSQRAIVATSALSSTKRTPEPDFKTECDMAVAFATLATTKAP